MKLAALCPQVVDPKARQLRHPDRPLPAVLDRHERLQGLRVGDQVRTALEARQGFDDGHRRSRQRDVTRLARFRGRDEPRSSLQIDVPPLGVEQFTHPSTGQEQ
jgi:hypothetical protein